MQHEVTNGGDPIRNMKLTIVGTRAVKIPRLKELILVTVTYSKKVT